ncbi:MAG: hypothetical protein Q9165_003034 [Trypethelium subeluteriae]
MPAPTRPDLKLNSQHLFDAIIIGAGPAGLSAGLALSRVKRTTVIFTSGEYRNEKAHLAHAILSRDHEPASEIRRIGREQISAYGTAHFVDRAVTQAQQNTSSQTFEAVDAHGETWRGRKVMLATGIRDVPPAIDGYASCWGSDIWQCLFCDGLERADRPAGTLGFANPMYLHNISIMFQLGCPSVTVFANGPLELGDGATARAMDVARVRGVRVDERRIRRLVRLEDELGIDVVFEDGSQTRVGFLVHKPDVKLVAPNLARDLGVEIVSDGKGGELLKRNEPFCETNVRGVFTAGDAGIAMKQFTVAMSQGSIAGAGINVQLCGEQDEEIVRKFKIAAS